ncbi:acyltransferase family protein [Chryseobacterium sp. HSC-36S06]|uniref:acyltransferase n=1 Tax=Chryseobacterium sp. HSC-36S06 TaxID=2910970 RepID=UPI0020A052EE|nr:surface polysaccharide O-acyltransferase-like enzyme [Chryseobacterium sp. HSC-36S06]
MKKDNIYWIDSLRVFATIAVIVLHVAAPIVYQFGSISGTVWWIGNIIDSSVRFCVPIFLMISGVLLLSKDYSSIRGYLKKRVLRIFYPFLFWSIIYLLKDILYYSYMGSMNIHKIDELIKNGVISGVSYHFWYIYLIIGLYLVFPLLSKWIKNSTKREIEYFLTLWFITLFITFPFISSFIPKINIIYFSGFIGFPILGYYLNNYDINSNNKKIVYFLLIVISITITAIGTFILSNFKNKFIDWFYNYLTPNVTIVSICIFLYFKEFVNPNEKINSIIRFFSKYSYGIYLVHILVLWSIQKIGLYYNFINPIIGIIITSLVCFVLSTIIIYFVNKFPLGKYIAGT